MLDTVVLLGAFVVVAAAAFFRWGVAEGAEFKITAASLLIATGLNVLIMFAYFCLLEATFGATLGKTLVGIRVVNNGRRHSWSAAAIRNALRMLDGIGFYALGALVASCSKGRQRLGDLFAGTIVVEHDFSVAAKVSAMLLWFASLIAAGWGIPGFLSENRPAQLPPQYLSQTVMQFGRIENSAHIRAGRFRIDFRSDSGAGERVHVAEPAAAKCGEGEGLANPRGQNAAGRIRQSAE